jgi:hypothetical protein
MKLLRIMKAPRTLGYEGKTSTLACIPMPMLYWPERHPEDSNIINIGDDSGFLDDATSSLYRD